MNRERIPVEVDGMNDKRAAWAKAALYTFT
jgi:hypothetical protein